MLCLGELFGKGEFVENRRTLIKSGFMIL